MAGALINNAEDLNRSIAEFITTQLKLGLHFAEHAVRYSREGRTLNVTQNTELKKQLTLLKDSFDSR